MAQPRAQAAAPGQQQDGGILGKATPIIRSMAIFFAIQTAMKYGMSYMGLSGKPTVAGLSGSGAPSDMVKDVPVVPAAPGTVHAEPLWPIGTPLSMLLYTSTKSSYENPDLSSPLVVWDGLTYGDWNDVREADLMLNVPEVVRSQNATWWMDIVLLKGGGTDFNHKTTQEVAMYRKQLTRFLPKRKIRKVKKLIGNEGDQTDEEDDSPAEVIAAHWSSNLTLSIVSSGGRLDIGSFPPVMRDLFQLAESGDVEPKHYYPPVFPNDFWLLRENLLPINATDKVLPLHVDYKALSQMKFQIFATMTQSFEQQAATQGSGAEMDEIKRMLTETSPWLLITTAIVTALHTVFEFLAFSSDIGHWRKKDKDLVGVSLRTILTNVFVQLVILLYLHDSSEQTSFMILFGQGIGLFIEAWKITKVTNVRVRPNPNSLIGYSLTFEDKKVMSEDEKKTQEYDKLAFIYVSYFAIPALIGYTGYSLVYETHRGWYSFVVTTLAQAIYMFGFVQLVPQLIINYKLKSVAHMPMKAMMYKTLGTVVDDFFAFCIRMPWLHRLACFRDDVVFVVLLYQRYIYRVDYSRMNEYGQVNEGMVEPVGEKDKAGEIEGETKKTK